MKNWMSSTSLRSILIIAFASIMSIYLLLYFLHVSHFRDSNNRTFEAGLNVLFKSNDCKDIDKSSFIRKLNSYISKCSYDVFIHMDDKLIYSGKKTLCPKNELGSFYFIEFPFKDDIIGIYYAYEGGLSSLFLFPVLMIPFVFIVVIVFTYMEKLEKNKEKKDLMLAMSKETAHQMGTPITSLRGWLELMKEELAQGTNFQNISLEECFDGINSDLERVEYILDCFSKLSDKIKKDVVKLEELINEVVFYLEKRLPRSLDKYVINTDIMWKGSLLLDRVLIYWAFENIIKNALDSIPFEQKGIVEIKVFEQKEKIIVEISDNGSGIAAKDKSKIFRPGFTTKKRGWGIGLSLVERVITDNHQGRVYLKSTSLNKGTTFRIELAKNQHS